MSRSMEIMSRISRFALVLLMAATASACGGDDPGTSPTPPSLGIPYSQMDLRVGTGVEALNGRRVTVDYTGWLYAAGAADNKGTQFEMGTYPYLLGGGAAIAGWERGIPGMRVGGARRLIIPPELGYGPVGRGPIPGNATLVFDVELVSVQ